MATVLDHLQANLPGGWQLTHLILLDPEWEAIITDGEYVCVATGADPEDAVTAAAIKAFDGTYVGRLAMLARKADEAPNRLNGDLLTALGLPKAKAPVVTRRI